MTTDNYTEHTLAQLTASAVDPNSVAITIWAEGRIGQQKWCSKPSGTTVPTETVSDMNFVEAILRQQLPNARIEIRGIRCEGPIS